MKLGFYFLLLISVSTLIHGQTTVPITNSNFDANYSGGAGSTNISGWTKSPSSNYWQTQGGYGDKSGYVGLAFFSAGVTSLSGTLSQTLTTQIAPFRKYTLSFIIFDSPSSGMNITAGKGSRLYAGSSLIPWSTSSKPFPSTKGTTWTYTANSGTLGANNPDFLKIEFFAQTSPAFSGYGSEGVWYDNVLLTVEQDSPLIDWRATQLESATSTGDAADTADPDQDGVVNLAEYALGGDPNTPNTANIPKAVNRNGVASITFQADSSKADIIYTVQGSPDLSSDSWQDIAKVELGGQCQPIEGRSTVTDTGNGVRMVEVQISPSNPTKSFYRLLLSKFDSTL
jgi:hypothetical protein